MSDLIERLRALARSEHSDFSIGDESADEIERLTANIKKANDQAEHFEREWYLRGDEIERLTAALHAQPGPVSLDDVEWAGKVHLAEAIRERDELRRQLAEAGESIARQAATIARMPAGPRG